MGRHEHKPMEVAEMPAPARFEAGSTHIWHSDRPTVGSVSVQVFLAVPVIELGQRAARSQARNVDPRRRAPHGPSTSVRSVNVEISKATSRGMTSAGSDGRRRGSLASSCRTRR